MGKKPKVPAVMVMSGLDPSGGAGIQADIETLSSHGCHTCPVITCNTCQDTSEVYRVAPVEATLVGEQIETILKDIPIAVFKIGLLGSLEIIGVINELLKDYPNTPVVLDPVLSSGSGTELSNPKIRQAIFSMLIPQVTVVTPNALEVRQLVPDQKSISDCAQKILDQGAEFVLVTGTHDTTPEVINTLYGNHRMLDQFRWPRLPHSYHGSGCTLAASIAGLLAQGYEPLSAVHEAQEYTWESLKKGYSIGTGQQIPNRFHWIERTD